MAGSASNKTLNRTEAVSHLTEGFVLDRSDDLDGLVSSLKTLAQDPALVARMGNAARKRMETEFDSRVHIKKLEGLFRSQSPEVIQT